METRLHPKARAKGLRLICRTRELECGFLRSVVYSHPPHDSEFQVAINDMSKQSGSKSARGVWPCIQGEKSYCIQNLGAVSLSSSRELKVSKRISIVKSTMFSSHRNTDSSPPKRITPAWSRSQWAHVTLNVQNHELSLGYFRLWFIATYMKTFKTPELVDWPFIVN